MVFPFLFLFWFVARRYGLLRINSSCAYSRDIAALLGKDGSLNWFMAQVASVRCDAFPPFLAAIFFFNIFLLQQCQCKNHGVRTESGMRLDGSWILWFGFLRFCVFGEYVSFYVGFLFTFWTDLLLYRFVTAVPFMERGTRYILSLKFHFSGNGELRPFLFTRVSSCRGYRLSRDNCITT